MSYYIHTIDHHISFRAETLAVTAGHEDAGIFLHAVLVGLTTADGVYHTMSEYRFGSAAYLSADTFEVRFVTDTATVKLQFSALIHGVRLTACDHTGAAVTLTLRGTLGTATDPLRDAFATSLSRTGIGLRAALGPAVTEVDNAILDRRTGVAALITDTEGRRPEGLSLAFDFDANAYVFDYTGKELNAATRTGMFRDLFAIEYRPINKSTFPEPPAGWMTWYAVKFDASEDVILKNAEIMRRRLFDFGANVLWVDWEWQHGVLTKEGPRGVDAFHPFTDRYPHGLAWLAERLSDMDLLPALWGGFTHEPGPCAFVDEHPETVLSDTLMWYGRYTFDPSHPTWREKYLLPAVRQFPAWGYRALKWDCLPSALSTCDKNRERMYNGGFPRRAMREAVALVRRELGDDYYMMSCSGGSDRSVLFAADLFDGARIGEDVFSWQDFTTTVDRLCHLYSLHNTVLYCDPDNVVLRPEFNTREQAITRATVVALLGLPTTIGDNLPDLPEDRFEILRRILPTVDAHPMDVRDYKREDDTLLLHLAIAKPYGKFDVIGVCNLAEEERTVTLSFTDDLHLGLGRYHAYDFWESRYLGIHGNEITLTVPAYSSTVLRLTPVGDEPTVVATSRHITMGGVDLLALSYDKQASLLSGTSAVVAGDDYVITVYHPTTKAIKTHTLHPTATGELDWQLPV